ncbi:NAD-dependent epimerase/dehydratase family protein [Mycolicibacterium smegmatis]|uniref:NAD-dependent epimerase/dehydratase n=2 Tax=Mycolicibacterium smegmatis (strain ATCC 700084 / mc(2)155) TaxID=246196 RepID=I7FIP7_MYCS2|nr:NAD-dependent epimerase/dehydratase family protein [Mycolicibacterium smegmatis]ABK71699.1 dihydrokaempferol 4-reductase [Mycolicibacterium smegmatis MC2 155]AFP38663.1 NAD-dependent epimerase/dehydratase [Mycolicibacterium smegmatis MC2 155]AIU07442.1 NAD-dependent dehydratase [Mycolicibacterium smegmatis MC2 155]AIU14067.1 NAD-dependent dehydratase [Mycolicibacterium smegmatis]AIU20690.1 NAD-dependent dehydratase [Mycolicibacterium smegmatis]
MDRRRKVLVMGASGNVGACVTRQLVERGDDVRVLLRRNSSTKGIDGLDVERHYGDIFDTGAVAAAVADRDVVFYCVVDTRAHLAAPAPLFRTNVEGLRNVLEVADHVDLHRFVFLSTIGTIAVGRNGEAVDEDTPFNWAGIGGPYIESRRKAEELVLSYAAERGFPAVVMNVSNPYGPPDWQPRQGALVAMAAFGKLPVYIRGVGAEVVGIDDAARALILAAEHGRIGERYIVSERYMSQQEMLTVAAEAVGARPPRIGIPMAAVYAFGSLAGLSNRLFRTDFPINLTAARLMWWTSPADHSKATRELGWKPAPTADAIARAAQFYVERKNNNEKVISL